MSQYRIWRPDGEVDICLPYDGDEDEDAVREAAINRLKTHSNQEPVFSGGQISEMYIDPEYPPAVMATVTGIDGLCMLIEIQLDAVEQVDLLEERLAQAKESIREEKQDEAEAD